jgi:hypothetical protein
MIKQFYEHLGVKFIRQEGGKNGPELIFVCPWCSGKSFSVNSKTGAWQCFAGCGSAWPYQFVMKLMPSLPPKDIFELLEKFGLGNDSPTAARTQAQAPKPSTPKLSKNDVRPITDDEIAMFCEAKGIDRKAFMSFRPVMHARMPWVLMPAYDPADMRKPCGWIRAGVDGSLVTIKYREDGEWKERQEKYPVVAGSNVGLLGLHALKAYDKIIFAEGWKDALAAMSHGYAAVANSSGAGKWRDSWHTVFAGKKVYVVFDADAAGVRGAAKVAEQIDEVAKWVRVVTLPYKVKAKGGLDLHDYLAGVRE